MHDIAPAYAIHDTVSLDLTEHAIAQALAIYQAHGPQSLTGQAALTCAGALTRDQRKSSADATEDAGAIHGLIEVTRDLIRANPDDTFALGFIMKNLKLSHDDILRKIGQPVAKAAAHDTEAAS